MVPHPQIATTLANMPDIIPQDMLCMELATRMAKLGRGVEVLVVLVRM